MSLLSIVLACSDSQVTPNFPPPKVEILDPIDGMHLLEGRELTLRGAVVEYEEDVEDLRLEWSSSLQGPLLQDTVVDGAEVEMLVPSGLEVGEHDIQFTATDAIGSAGMDVVSVVVEANTAPEVVIVSPVDGATVGSHEPLTLIATIDDAHTSSEDLIWLWTSSLDGQLLGETEQSGNTTSVFLEEGLSEGSHHLELQAIDELGAVGVDSVEVEATENAAPEVVFLRPSEGDHFEDHSTIAVEVSVEDAEDRGDDLVLEWSGLVEEEWVSGDLPEVGTSGGTVTTTLRIECNHYYGVSEFVLGLTATDTAGASGSGSVVVTTTCPPG